MQGVNGHKQNEALWEKGECEMNSEEIRLGLSVIEIEHKWEEF